MPRSNSGSLAVLTFVVAVALFVVGAVSFGALYAGVPAGDSIGADLAARPVAAGAMVCAGIAVIVSFAAAVWSAFRQKDRSPAVIAVLLVGALFIVFLCGEFVVAH